MAARDVEDDKPSLLYLLVDSAAFLVRKGGMFLTIVLPIAGIAAGPDGTLYVSADADGSVAGDLVEVEEVASGSDEELPTKANSSEVSGAEEVEGGISDEESVDASAAGSSAMPPTVSAPASTATGR